MDLYKAIIVLVSIWSISWLVPIYLLRKFKKSYISNPIFFSIIFGVSLFAYIFFFKETLLQYQNVSFELLIGLAICIVTISLVYKLFKSEVDLSKISVSEYWILLDQKYILPKTFEILSQQMFVTILILVLKSNGFSLLQTIIAFGIVFPLCHLPMFFYRTRRLGAFYFIAAVLSALLFPLVILNSEIGPIITFAIHWGFYLIAGIFFNHSPVFKQPKIYI